MHKTIKLNTDAAIYEGTFFEDLQIALHETHGRHVAIIEKTHWFGDRRYNPVRRAWRVVELVQMLKRVQTYGALAPSEQTTDHGSFSVIEPSRLEFVAVNEERGGIFLNDWFFQPLYRFGEFDAFTVAVAMLSDAQTYIDGLPIQPLGVKTESSDESEAGAEDI